MQCSVVKCSVGQFSAVKYVWDSEVEKRGGGDGDKFIHGTVIELSSIVEITSGCEIVP